MKNKRKLKFLPLVFATGLILSGCFLDPKMPEGNSGWLPPEPTSHEPISNSSEMPTSSQGGNTSSSQEVIPAAKTYVVTFMNAGLPLQISEVKEGQCAVYSGETPTKRADAGSKFYRFKGWDRDIKAPITEDTVFNAQFTSYQNEMMVDDFESYADSGSMKDEGWKALGYNNQSETWTTETSAAVSLGSKSVEGQKALRFDAWENGTGYKFAKEIADGTFTKAVNALKFRLMVPKINTVKVLLHAKVMIEGTLQNPSFTYTLQPTSSEYVEYTIPLADDGWALWGKAGDSIAKMAGWVGVHQDDLVNYLTRIEFYVQGNDGIGGQPYAAFLDSVKFVTLDTPELAEKETMGSYNRYTGELATGNVVRLDIAENGDASATIVDMEVPQTIPGKVIVNADKTIKFTSADEGQTLEYIGKLVNGGQQVEFVSATGAVSQMVGEMNMNAVQVVDNYESYATDGVAYYQNSPIGSRSGCRGAYYSEYYAGGTASAPWGKSGWSLLGGQGDQLKLKQDSGAHSGNQYLCVKHSKSFAFRYMQFGLFDGTAEQNAFRGTTLSFWARTNGYVNNFKVSMYSQSAPTLSTKDSYVKSVTVNPTAALGEWTHYELELNPNLTYYGFMIFTEKNTNLSGNEAWLYIDDVEVYTANPYKVYVPDAQLTAGQTFLGKVNKTNNVVLQIGTNGIATISAPAYNMGGVACPYTINKKEVTFQTGGLGNVVATINDDNSKITVTSATGQLGLLQGLVLNEVKVTENVESYDKDGQMYYQGMTNAANRSGLRGAYYCDWYTGGSGSAIGGSGWALLGGSGDQLSRSTQYVHSGSYSMKVRRNNGSTMRYTTWGLSDGTATALPKSNVLEMYVKNPNSVQLKLKVAAYYQQQVTPSTQSSNRSFRDDYVIPANSDWTRITLDLNSTKTYYGFSLIVVNSGSGNSSDYFYVDDINFYSEDNNINAYYSTYKNETFTGNIAVGQASIRFDELGVCHLACAALGSGEVDCKYNIVGNELTIKVPQLMSGSGSVIVGTLASNPGSNTFTFTTTSTTGELAAAVPNGTVMTANIA